MHERSLTDEEAIELMVGNSVCSKDFRQGATVARGSHYVSCCGCLAASSLYSPERPEGAVALILAHRRTIPLGIA
jgi:hypothetical protein